MSTTHSRPPAGIRPPEGLAALSERSLPCWRELLDGLPVGVVVVDAQGRAAFVNRTSVRLLGAPLELGVPLREQLERYPVFVAGTAERYPYERLPLMAALRGDGGTADDVELRRDERALRLQVLAVPIHDHDGRLAGAAAVFQDVTKRLEAERALAAERDLQSAFLDTVGALVVVMDPAGRVVEFNRACERLTGYRKDELLGRFVWERLLTSEESASVKEVFARLASGMFPNENENDWVDRDGGRHRIAWSNTAVLDERGSVRFVIGTGLDVTAQRRLEALREQLLIDERDARRRAEEAVALRDDFLTVASHELRTPLTSLHLVAEQLVRLRALGLEVSEPRMQRALDAILRQVRRLEGLVDELLDVANLQSGALVLKPEDVDLARLVREVAERFERPLEQSGSRLSIDAEPVVGRWDRSRLDQVVTHLLSNAVKFGEGRPIRVGVERRGERAVLVVADQGIGIHPDAARRVFERFERAVSSRQFPGLGLGLFLSRRLVERMGGTIRVDSAPGEGSTFTVELPLAGPEAAP